MILSADTVNGVRIADKDDGALLPAQYFYDSLDDLQDGEIIFAEVSLSIAKKIKKEYGIHR